MIGQINNQDFSGSSKPCHQHFEFPYVDIQVVKFQTYNEYTTPCMNELQLI